MQHFTDTICAPATVPGTGAVSIIRLSGPSAHAIADKVVRLRKGTVGTSAGYSLKMGSVYDGLGADASLLDSVLVSVFRAPKSYTGEDSVEISCHASRYIANRILSLLVDAGARMAGPGEFTQRAFVNGKLDLSQAEAVADIVAANSKAEQRVAMTQLKGGYSDELRSLREQLLNMASLMELELDFSEEEVEFASRSELSGLIEATLGRINRLAASFHDGNAIKNGIPVAIVGAVNTGKSTLLNALVGEERAIVSDEAGTTRDTIEETMLLDGVLFRFVDTAGLREDAGKVERIGIGRSLESLSKASIVLAVLDGSLPLQQLRASFAELASKVDFERQSLIVVRNKKDVCGGSWLLSAQSLAADLAGLMDRAKVSDCGSDVENVRYSNGNFEGVRDAAAAGCEISSAGTPIVVDISARTGEGLEELKAQIVSARPCSADNGEVMVTNLRHYEALVRAGDALLEVKSALTDGVPTDLVAQSLRIAVYELGTILGEVTTDEILGEIFGKFCIGK